MKLNHSSTANFVTFIYINIIIIPILFTHLSSQQTSSSSSPQKPSSDNSNQEDTEHHHYPQQKQQQQPISDDKKKLIFEQSKASLIKMLGLKEVPKKPKHKAIVPQAMLQEYINLRDSVREFIPDDRDFFGKIDIHDIEEGHEDYWSAIHNKFGSNDIEVDMDDGPNPNFLYKGHYERMIVVRLQDDPKDVPISIEPILPPYQGSTREQKQFTSVHLNFNLSQVLSNDLVPIEELRAAELHLSRDRIDAPQCQVSTYQRVYLLVIIGYDSHNEPITRIHDTLLIDTRKSTPLLFDILDVVKDWSLNPSGNFGLIVRVTSDGKECESTQKRTTDITTSTSSLVSSNSKKTTNASHDDGDVIGSISTQSKGQKVVDHVRLKREYRSASASGETWVQKQPSLFVFTSPTDADTRRHVKRDHSTNSASNRNQRARTRGKNARTAEKCSRKTLQINFDEVGWSSWIIAPQAYFANYCLGDCTFPTNDIQNATNHAIIQSIFHSVGRVIPKSCCAPTKLGNMAILYQLDGVVQMRHYDDMIVEACGCV